MTNYLVYSTVAGKLNKKIRCGNSCRRINLPLCLVWERRSHTSFFSNTFLPGSNNFWTNFSSARNQMLFINQYSAVSKNLFLTCCSVFLKLRYRDIVAFRTKNWMDENLIIDSLQTSRFPLWRRKILSDHFQWPCDAINTLQGKVPA